MPPLLAARRGDVPSTSMTVASCPSQTRAAFRAMAFRTGCRLVGELEITRRISLVAVCCSSDSVT